jgi:hypothetical protein
MLALRLRRFVMRSMLHTAAALAVIATIGCASSNNNPTSVPSSAPTTVSGSTTGVIPVGQELDVRLQQSLSSGTAKIEDRFDTTTVVDLRQDGRVLIPAGSTIRGQVTAVDPAGKVDRSGKLMLAFDRLSIGGRNYELRAMATQVFESKGIREEGSTVGAGGAVGAIVGGIIGGVRGALIGAAIGAGGVVAATEGKDIELPAGTVMRLRFDAPLDLRGNLTAKRQ